VLALTDLDELITEGLVIIEDVEPLHPPPVEEPSVAEEASRQARLSPFVSFNGHSVRQEMIPLPVQPGSFAPTTRNVSRCCLE
jgi:hypothetical protein